MGTLQHSMAMLFAKHRVCILVALLAFTLVGVESRRGGRLRKGSLRTTGSFVIAANRAGNDELEESTELGDEALSESLDESPSLPLPTEDNTKFCVGSASLRDGMCMLRGEKSATCKDAIKFHQNSCQSTESVLGAGIVGPETSSNIAQQIQAVLNAPKKGFHVNLDYRSLKVSTDLGKKHDTTDQKHRQYCLVGGDVNDISKTGKNRPGIQNLTQIPGGVSMEFAAVPGANEKDKKKGYDCQRPIEIEVSGVSAFTATRVELAWSGFKEYAKCSLFCLKKDTRATVALQLLRSNGDAIARKSTVHCAAAGATSERPCTVNLHPPVEASGIRITIQGCSASDFDEKALAKALGYDRSRSSTQRGCREYINTNRPTTFQIRAFSEAGSFGWNEPVKARLQEILERTPFTVSDSWVKEEDIRVIKPWIRDKVCSEIFNATDMKFQNWITPTGGQFVQDPDIKSLFGAVDAGGTHLLGAGKNGKGRRSRDKKRVDRAAKKAIREAKKAAREAMKNRRRKGAEPIVKSAEPIVKSAESSVKRAEVTAIGAKVTKPEPPTVTVDGKQFQFVASKKQIKLSKTKQVPSHSVFKHMMCILPSTDDATAQWMGDDVFAEVCCVQKSACVQEGTECTTDPTNVSGFAMEEIQAQLKLF